MVIIETPVFTKIISRLMDDDQYRELQEAIIENPLLGDLVKESGGLRKLRWKLGGRGKRGGVRVIYYGAIEGNQIYMLYLYAKNEQADLTKDQLKALRKVVARW